MRRKPGIIIFSTNSENVEKINNIISTPDYNTVKISSQDELLNYINEKQPEIIIIDSDSELCSKLKADNNIDSLVLFINSASAGLQSNVKCNSDFYLEFPFSDQILITNVSLLLKEYKFRKNLKQITESVKESEQKYKRLFQLSPDGMGYHVGGKIGFINDAGLKILGAKSFEEVFGKYFFDFVHPFDKKYIFEQTKSLPEDKPVYNELKIISLDGLTKYIDIVSTPFILGGINAVQFIIRDITEKKINELNLIENTTRLEFVQSIAKLGYWELDIRNDKLTWSKDIFKILGMKDDGFQTSLKNFLSIIHPDDRKIFQKALDASLTGLVPLDIENRMIKSNGEIIFVYQRGIVTYDEKGNIAKLIGSLQDITDRKQMENALRESQSRLSGIINSAMDAVITIDIDQKIILFNNTAEKMFRCSAEEVIGKSINIFIPFKYRGIHKKHIESFSKTGISMRNMGSINPISGLRADGKEFPIEASISQVEVGGQKLFTVIIRDVTEKKQTEDALISSEARYRLLFKKNPLPMWVFDLENLNILAVNFAAVRVYGYTRDEFLSMTIMDIRPEEDIPALKNYISAVRSPFQAAGMWRHKKKDGTIIDVEVVSHEIEFDGRLSRIVLTNDITNKKKAEDELKNSKEQLRLLAAHLQNIREEERSAIAREIHDELGQVLTSLKMNLTFIDKKLIGNEDKINTNDLHKEINGMTSVIDDSVKRIRKIITELRPELLDQLGLISALEWQAGEFKAKSGINCELINSLGEYEINKNISIAVYRIFQEALTNIIRHSQASNVEVKIGKNNNHLEFEISDDGVGIDLNNTKTKTFGVLGMRERVIILGGDFSVERIEPSGTKVTLNIPLDVN